MAAYALRRLLWLGPALVFISLVTFALMHAVPGGPWDDASRPLPAEVVTNLQQEYGLDRPLWRQYLDFAAGALQGDLGLSFAQQGRPVSEILVSGFKVSASLGLLAVLVATLAGIGLGTLSALHHNRLPDRLALVGASLGAAVPSFVLAIFLIYLFSVKLDLLPAFGWDLKHGVLPGYLGRPQQIVLPVVTLAVLPAAYLARVTRAGLLDVLGQDYMRTARAKGLGERSILLRHGLRNALIPVVTLLGPMAGGLLMGSFIIEQMFSIPGSGRLFVHSVDARDYGLIMGATLFYAAIIVVANLAVDIAYAWLDPRVRYR